MWKEIIYHVGLNSEEIKLLKKQRSKILKYKERFNVQLQKFLKIKKEFFKISREMEKTLDEVGKKVKPIQRARFLKYVDTVKHRKELNVFELWGVKCNKVQEPQQNVFKCKTPSQFIEKKNEDKSEKIQINPLFEKSSPEQIAAEILQNEGNELDMFEDHQSIKEYEWKNKDYIENEESEDSGLPDSGDED